MPPPGWPSPEGRFDATSLTGKVTGSVLAAAAAAGTPSALVAGDIAAPLPPGCRAGIALADLAGGGDAARGDPARWLEAAALRLARDPAVAGQ